MKTYQDLEALGNNEQARMDFIRALVAEHKGSEAYRQAADAEEYYAKQNITILKFQKVIMSAMGEAIPDVWSSNYKLTHGFFRQFVLQQTQYVLANGVSFVDKDKRTKERLGRNFDGAVSKLAKRAMVDGVAFGFWNNDHLDVFSFADTPLEPGFAPLHDGTSGLLRAGVRYWQPAENMYRWTLYEADGYTEYIQTEDEEMHVLSDKRAYKLRERRSAASAVEEIRGENYPGFPIIPMYANDLKQSELVGIRPSIDCYDFIKSGMANAIDETSVFYWTLKGSGGMDDVDLVNFVQRMKQLHAQVLDRGVEAEAHTLSVPYEANKILLDYLKEDLYENFMLMNSNKALAGDKTATAIRLAYQPQDDKCGDFEACIRDFIAQLLALLGIDDEPTFKWNRIANLTEETQMVMTAAQYLDDETVLNHLSWLTPEEVEAIMERKAAEDIDRFNNAEGSADDGNGDGNNKNPPLAEKDEE